MPRAGDAVVEALRIHDAFGDAEADAGGQSPEGRVPPGLSVVGAVIKEERQGLANFLAEADAAGEANEAEKEGRYRDQWPHRTTRPMRNKTRKITPIMPTRIRSRPNWASDWTPRSSKMPPVAVNRPRPNRCSGTAALVGGEQHEKRHESCGSDEGEEPMNVGIAGQEIRRAACGREGPRRAHPRIFVRAPP